MSRRAEMILGVIGGIFGILMGIFAVVVGGIGSAFDPHDASSTLVSSLGLVAVILGVLGIVGGAVVNKNKKNGWWLNASLWFLRIHSSLHVLGYSRPLTSYWRNPDFFNER